MEQKHYKVDKVKMALVSVLDDPLRPTDVKKVFPYPNKVELR